jgi:hypothetical protein
MASHGDVLRWRPRLVTWLILAALTHVIVGLLVFFFSDSSWMDDYHRTVARVFWPNGFDLHTVKREQAWWMSLFGATVQCLGIWMLALVLYAGRHRIAEIWLWIAIGLLVWAPQDMFLSWRAGIAVHLIVDSVALLAMLPPLILLWRWDRAIR